MSNFYKRGLSKGFTLIELLVVIAIIGILASIILASLSTARSKGNDAAVKEELSDARSQAELYTGATNQTGSSPCVTSGANLFGTASNGLGSILNGVSGNYSAGFTSSNSYCYYVGGALPSAGGKWAIAVLLPSGTAGTGPYWCVDYMGNSGSNTSGGSPYTTLSGVSTVTTAAFDTSTDQCN